MDMETARKTLFHFFHTYRWKFAVILILVTLTHWTPARHLYHTVRFMSLVSLHTRVSICRNGNKTHLEKALSFSDFRAQSEHGPVRENGWCYIQLCFLH